MTPQEPLGEEGGASGIARTVRRYEKVPMFCDMGTFFSAVQAVITEKRTASQSSVAKAALRQKREVFLSQNLLF